tara:strand:+ start:177 stop:506 length:330 start_codon:yes stop_codon:yes gene_type:complete
MIVDLSTENKLFLIECANWKSIQVAVDPEEAGALALEEAYQEYKERLALSPTISIFDLSNPNISPNDCHILNTPTALANAGMHSISKKYSTVMKLMINKINDNDSKDIQ